ncbi:hypothetical protein [Simiduia aestuariiviva]|uniref:Lipoprotein n=1 Tax=Simiduia aestuariiviva TaxID=1510459 RepID=A0A839UNX4_9GAMM|nr:hypothetical protein [Simiduia aestuariiviva]MBB3167085.1 hypothetical protein [Simiduia aestuariiviva]
MINRIILVALISMIISSCGASNSHKKVLKSDNIPAKSTMPALSLETVDFSGDLDVRKVKVECSMLEKLSTSILDSATKYNANIISHDDPSASSPKEYTLKVTYVNVIPHRWTFMAIRPSSSATVAAEILKGGKVIKFTKKVIGSGVAFGACDRLEKIAITGGRYIAKWSSQQVYE